MDFDRKYTSFNKTDRKLVLCSQPHLFSCMASNAILMVTALAHTDFLSSRSAELSTWCLIHKHLTKHFQNQIILTHGTCFVSQRSGSHPHSFSVPKLKKSPDAVNFLFLATSGNIVYNSKKIVAAIHEKGTTDL